jgi:E3 ubiquitin-protein ligase ZNF598
LLTLLNFSDICTWNKKIFTHEHSLFTREQLNKHIREGDEDTGFKGHPECQFCQKPFYGDDELYEHCRHNHEQCFICVRAGIRDIYFRHYNSLVCMIC